MTALTQQVNDSTAFVYKDGSLIPIEEAQEIETGFLEDVSVIRATHLAEDEGWMLAPEFIKEREGMLYSTVMNFVLAKVSEYLEIKAENQVDWQKKNVVKDTKSQIETSMLLKRLLAGKAPLPKPPPKSYEFGWYELVEDGEDVCLDVTYTSAYTYPNSESVSSAYMMIDGHRWNILSEDKEKGEYIVEYDKSRDYIFRLSRMQADDWDRLLHPRLRRLVNNKELSWKLTRTEHSSE